MPDPRHLALLLLLAAMPASAEEPLSAIPWLSESVRNPVFTLPPGSSSSAANAITATPLDQIDRDSFGLVLPQVAGLPENFWGATPRDRVAALIQDHADGGVPATRALFLELLLASNGTGLSQPGSQDLLLARIDKLLERGALDQAEALLNLAGADDIESFRRMVDIGLLTGRADPMCQKYALTPNLAPTLPVRVFCLARAGDWNAAALTLSLGREIGAIPENQDELLHMFLDPGLFDDDHEPPIPDPLTPFDFVLRESLGLPRPAENLPMAFLQVDLVRDTPMRIRIGAAERLVRSGAISPTVLFAAYRAGKPAASGGIWDRAAAVQALDAALDLGDAALIAAALADLTATESDFDLISAAAQEYGSRLLGLSPNAALGNDSLEVARVLLLAGQPRAAAKWLPESAPVPLRLALAILAGQQRAIAPDTLDATQLAVVDAFNGTIAASTEAQNLLDHLQQGQTGEAILGALQTLADGSAQDPANLGDALHVLIASGLEPHARRIAVETLLLTTDRPT